MCLHHVDLQGLVFLASSVPSGFSILSTSSSVGFPELCGEGFDDDTLFGAEYSKTCPSLHNVWPRVSVFVSICRRRLESEQGTDLLPRLECLTNVLNRRSILVDGDQ